MPLVPHRTRIGMAARSACCGLLIMTLALSGCSGSGEPEGTAAPRPGPSEPSTRPPDPGPPGTGSRPPLPPAVQPGQHGHPDARVPAAVWPYVELARPELPRGGRTLFPRYRLIGYAGHPTADALGRLGIGSIDARAAELERRAGHYTHGREAQPVFELIAVIATSFPGPDGQYRSRVDSAVVDEFLAAARRHRALLLLNIQPGRSDFLTEVKVFRRWLAEPDVGLALDPEWAVGPGQVPGDVYGHTTGSELNRVAAYLADLVAAYDLPEKVMVFHQVAASVVSDQDRLRDHPGIVVIKSVDGIGPRGAKEETWRRLVGGLPDHLHTGFKLFFVEDARSGPLMSPDQVLALRPRPVYVMYE